MYSTEKMIEQMRNVPHFKNAPEVLLRDIVNAGQVVRAAKDSLIFTEGMDSAGLYVLLQGKVHLIKTGVQGQETIVLVIKPVIMFNEVSVLDGGPNPVSARAIQDCILWRISFEGYQDLMRRYPQMGTGLLRTMAGRLREMLTRIEDLSSRPVLSRTAKILLILSNNGQNHISRSQHSNQEIASLISSVPGAISRSLKNLHDIGLIDLTRNRITITNLESLTCLAKIEPVEGLKYPGY